MSVAVSNQKYIWIGYIEEIKFKFTQVVSVAVNYNQLYSWVFLIKGTLKLSYSTWLEQGRSREHSDIKIAKFGQNTTCYFS